MSLESTIGIGINIAATLGAKKSGEHKESLKAMQYTVDQIKSLITNNDIAVGRAMVALYNEQTIDEKSDGQTKNTNGRGFSFRTAPKGTYYAKWVLSGKRLTGYHLENARKIAMFHIKQLTNLANKNVVETKPVVQQEYSLAVIDDSGEMIMG